MTEREYCSEIEFIFNRFPSYQRVGKIAYKPGIETMLYLDKLSGYPHKSFKTIHIAGTNGKGSTSHMLASALMQLGYKVGLYTSPHLWDFRERIKVSSLDNSGRGTMRMVDKDFVYKFIIDYKDKFIECDASFFEITTVMAFDYFKKEGVDIAVIECGLGGRLDSTNIISPILSIITNIGLDHCEHLGYSLPEIAREKAGIIKAGVPIIIGESNDEIKSVFIEKAKQENAPIIFAQDLDDDTKKISAPLFNAINLADMDLSGYCQRKNIKAVVIALSKLFNRDDKTFLSMIPKIVYGINNAASITGLHGRWERLYLTSNGLPEIICDTGHNSHGFRLIGEQILEKMRTVSGRLIIIFGVAADKDLDSIVQYIPKKCVNAKGVEVSPYFYYVNAAGKRALPAKLLAEKMKLYGFNGEPILSSDGNGTVNIAINTYLKDAMPDDFVFIGGSSYVVGEIFLWEQRESNP